MEIFNEPGDEHLPADEVGMATLHTFALVVLAGACLLLVKLSYERMKDTSSIHAAVLMLGAAMALSFLDRELEFMELFELELPACIRGRTSNWAPKDDWGHLGWTTCF